MADSPASSLSELLSDDFAEDTKPVKTKKKKPAPALMPGAKRQKVGPGSFQLWEWSGLPPADADMEISSDSSGEAPSSPLPFDIGPQVTRCQWDHCSAGDMGTMDELVRHLLFVHMGIRQTKFQCQWAGCPRKGMNHVSSLALKNHLRSHTNERPYYCALPECGEAFIRIEDPTIHIRETHCKDIPKQADSLSASAFASAAQPHRTQRLKLTLSARPPPEAAAAAEVGGSNGSPTTVAGPTSQPSSYPADVVFSAAELALPPQQLFRLLRRQEQWTRDEHAELAAEVQALETQKRHEWQRKEAVLDDVIRAEEARRAARDKEMREAEAWKVNATQLLRTLQQESIDKQGQVQAIVD
ncbi:MAG: hypothetical protein M1829_001795 [Trizodia sp. TS-e1964]|nr:MAG: hypothetical protein M1829_001795 [Trizodia sp. TS-e1964]